MTHFYLASFPDSSPPSFIVFLFFKCVTLKSWEGPKDEPSFSNELSEGTAVGHLSLDNVQTPSVCVLSNVQVHLSGCVIVMYKCTIFGRNLSISLVRLIVTCTQYKFQVYTLYTTMAE